MDYNFCALSDELFQKLCQALIVRDFPGAQCLPVGQPDGGRDAFAFDLSPDPKVVDLIVFQVKFSKNPTNKDERDAIIDLIRSESKKIGRLKDRGLSKYYFITNVAGTSHFESGSVDKVNEIIKSEIGVNAYCWWSDDISRRIDGRSDIKWSFPEIIRATDLLQALVGGDAGESALRRQNAIRTMVNFQYSAEYEVKFKEIELKYPLMDLFVDMPIYIHERDEKEDRLRSGQYYRDPVLAANFALNIRSSDHRDLSLVLQGAPGQGKSTVTQYICQIYRLRFLDKAEELAKAPAAVQPSLLRLPIRADLRDFAAWLEDGAGKSSANNLNDKVRSPSLESFLAAQIGQSSGGIPFDVNHLHMVLSSVWLLLALDGFDEVADVATRDRMIKEIEAGIIPSL